MYKMYKSAAEGEAAVFFLFLIIFGVIFVPLIAIWCVNTLFGTGIEITLLNWFCSLILLMVAGK